MTFDVDVGLPQGAHVDYYVEETQNDDVRGSIVMHVRPTSSISLRKNVGFYVFLSRALQTRSAAVHGLLRQRHFGTALCVSVSHLNALFAPLPRSSKLRAHCIVF